MMVKRRTCRVLDELATRWIDEGISILLLVIVTMSTISVTLGKRYGWGSTDIMLMGCVGTVLIVCAAELAYALTDRRSSSRWRTQVTHLHERSPMPEPTRQHLYGWDWVHKTRPPGAVEVHPGEYDRRDPRVLRRWHDHGLPMSLLAAFLYAGLSDREVFDYLNASPGSQTRTEFEFLARLAAPADAF